MESSISYGIGLPSTSMQVSLDETDGAVSLLTVRINQDEAIRLRGKAAQDFLLEFTPNQSPHFAKPIERLAAAKELPASDRAKSFVLSSELSGASNIIASPEFAAFIREKIISRVPELEAYMPTVEIPMMRTGEPLGESDLAKENRELGERIALLQQQRDSTAAYASDLSARIKEIEQDTNEIDRLVKSRKISEQSDVALEEVQDLFQSIQNDHNEYARNNMILLISSAVLIMIFIVLLSIFIGKGWSEQLILSAFGFSKLNLLPVFLFSPVLFSLSYLVRNFGIQYQRNHATAHDARERNELIKSYLLLSKSGSIEGNDRLVMLQRIFAAYDMKNDGTKLADISTLLERKII